VIIVGRVGKDIIPEPASTAQSVTRTQSTRIDSSNNMWQPASNIALNWTNNFDTEFVYLTGRTISWNTTDISRASAAVSDECGVSPRQALSSRTESVVFERQVDGTCTHNADWAIPTPSISRSTLLQRLRFNKVNVNFPNDTCKDRARALQSATEQNGIICSKDQGLGQEGIKAKDAETNNSRQQEDNMRNNSRQQEDNTKNNSRQQDNMTNNSRRQDNMTNNSGQHDNMINNGGQQDNMTNNSRQQDNMTNNSRRQDNMTNNSRQQGNMTNNSGQQSEDGSDDTSISTLVENGVLRRQVSQY
jgi:hypothetical protein